MKIIVDNSRWSRLKGFSRKLGLKLDNRLSAKIPGIEFSKRFKRALQSKRWDGCQHFFNRLNGKFPTGMIPFVQMLLKKSVFIENERTEKNERILAKARKRFDKLRLDPKPRKEQNEAILNALTKGRGLICMATNAGKTLVACGILESLRKKALYIVHTKDLLKQTVYNLKTKTSLKITMVGDGAYNWDGDVVVAMVQTLTPMLKRKKALMKSLSKFRVFICDEAHHQTAKTWYKLAMLCPAWFRFGMSGTIPKDLYDKFRIQSAVGSDVLSKVTNEELIQRGTSAKPIIHLYEFNHGASGNLGDFRSALEHLVITNLKMISAIRKVIEYYADKGPVLVLTDQIRQGVQICQMLGGSDLSYSYLDGRSISDVRVRIKEQFERREFDVLIATPIWDEGVDLPELRTLVLASGGKRERRLLQRVGRAIRKKKHGPNVAHIVDFFHLGNEFLEEHSVARLDLWEREGFEVRLENKPALD